MASPATARRNDLHAGKFDMDHISLQSPVRAPRSHDSTPRPSISPLSTASAPPKHSPGSHSLRLLDGDATDDRSLAATGTDAANEDDDRSSSLSDIGDDDEDLEAEQELRNAMARSRPRSITPTDDVDSEAETERLNETPQKRHNLIDTNGRTPSKLSQAAVLDEDLSDPPSPLPVDPAAASSTNTIATTGIKRKRSESSSSSLTSQDDIDRASPRKRTHSSTLHAQLQGELEMDIRDENEEAIIDDETPLPRVSPEDHSRAPSKGARGRNGKSRGRKVRDAVDEQGQDDEHEQDEQDREQETAHPSVEPNDEQSDEKSEEDLRQRSEALALFTEVATQFVAFKEKMYNERLALLNAEVQMLMLPDCAHPEYLRMVACVDARYEKQVREAQAYHSYKMKAIKQRTIGERSQLHSQYFQHVRELRDEAMTTLGEDWYNIQKERRDTYQEKDQWLYKFPTKRSAQIRQQVKYNQEVSVLSGFAKHVGFPAAPDIQGANDTALDEDLRAMRIPKRAPQPAPAAHQISSYNFKPHAFPPPPTNERLAHEQYLEQNAWARPQGPIPAHGTPNLTHTPDWAEPTTAGTAKHVMRNLSGLPRVKSPFTTPMPPRRQHVEHSSAGTVPNSEVTDPPSSVIAAPPTSNRADGLQHYNQSSPLTVLKHRISHNDGVGANGERELTGFRNVSNMSSISNASTVDAPIGHVQDSENKAWEEKIKNAQPGHHQSMWHSEHPPQQPFLTSALHRLNDSNRLHDGMQKHSNSALYGGGTITASSPPRPPDSYIQTGFRPQEGAFGTPAPLPSANGAPALPAATTSGP
ncbi:hypothetical protein K431DRAFT_287910 [Polychaeton citri CBS 116435]|uniref:Transcriptional regulatory protein DEP1 n=1 Tax=Polychaeton citri CBS 116435 TaxID=1314669 RepID=A0A9P4Q4A8_9PEZI|nr:hypothetical protein K431DRAFT_287910 [Polychaeton citri CBS 116435]